MCISAVQNEASGWAQLPLEDGEMVSYNRACLLLLKAIPVYRI